MDRKAKCYIGTSGWSYPHWRDGFYAGVPQRQWLAHCAEHFSAIEVNTTFYGSQRLATFDRWRHESPPDFRFAIKGNRYITHNRKLKEPDGAILHERSRALGLGDKLAAVLWQLPPNWSCDLPRLRQFTSALTRLWPEPRHVMEFRHTSWFNDEVAETLAERRIALCLSDAADWPLWERVTTDLVYIRLHGHQQTYTSAYDDAALRHWGERCRDWLASGHDVHLYFNNDAAGAAPDDAQRLIALLGE